MQKELINSEEMDRMLDRLAFQIIEACPDIENAALVGIYRRGVTIAQHLRELIKKHTGKEIKYGTIDITLYRDDLEEIDEFPKVYATSLPFDLKGQTIVLVDDVLYTGRTVRAALEAIADFGRPARILLLTFIDRGHRELPIHADFVGKSIPTRKDEIVHVFVEDIDQKKGVSIEVR